MNEINEELTMEAPQHLHRLCLRSKQKLIKILGKACVLIDALHIEMHGRTFWKQLTTPGAVTSPQRLGRSHLTHEARFSVSEPARAECGRLSGPGADSSAEGGLRYSPQSESADCATHHSLSRLTALLTTV